MQPDAGVVTVPEAVPPLALNPDIDPVVEGQLPPHENVGVEGAEPLYVIVTEVVELVTAVPAALALAKFGASTVNAFVGPPITECAEPSLTYRVCDPDDTVTDTVQLNVPPPIVGEPQVAQLV